MDMPATIPPFSEANPVSCRGQADHPVKSQNQRDGRARRLRYLPTQGRWDEPETAGLHAGIKLSAAGLAALGRSMSGRIRRIKHHCGRCRFYQADSGAYSLGRCAAAPGEPAVRRADTCPSFHFSERAMVRERLSQRPDLLKQIHITRAG